MNGACNVGFRNGGSSCCAALSFGEVPVKNTFIHFDVPYVAVLSDRTFSSSSHFRARSCPAFAGPFCCVNSCSWEGATQLLAHAMMPSRCAEEPSRSLKPERAHGQDSHADSYFTPESTPRGSGTAIGFSMDDALSSCSSSWQSMRYTQDDVSDPSRRSASGRAAAVSPTAVRDGSAARRHMRQSEASQRCLSPTQRVSRSTSQPNVWDADECCDKRENGGATEPEPEDESNVEKEFEYAGWNRPLDQGSDAVLSRTQQPFFSIGDATAYGYQAFGDEYQEYLHTAGEQEEAFHQSQVALPLQQLVPPPYNASTMFAPPCAIPQMAMPGTMFIPVAVAPMQQVMQTPLLMPPVQASCTDDVMADAQGEVSTTSTAVDGVAQYSESHASSSSSGRRTQRFEVGIEEDNCFRVVRRLIGPAGECMKRIVNESHGAKVWICGEGACPTEKQMRVDQAAGPLSICVSAMSGTSFDIAVRLVQELLSRIQADYQAYLEKQKKSDPPATIKPNGGRFMQRT